MKKELLTFAVVLDSCSLVVVHSLSASSDIFAEAFGRGTSQILLHKFAIMYSCVRKVTVQTLSLR